MYAFQCKTVLYDVISFKFKEKNVCKTIVRKWLILVKQVYGRHIFFLGAVISTNNIW